MVVVFPEYWETFILRQTQLRACARCSQGELSDCPEPLPNKLILSVFLFQHHSDALNWVMLRYAIIFFVIALVAEALGAFGVAGEAAWIAHVLIVIAVIFIIISFFSGRRGPPVV